MIPLLERRPPLALAAALCPILVFACGRVPGQFEILNNQVPMSSGGGCSIPVEPTIYQGQGTLDVSIVRDGLSSAYLVFPLIENNLPASTGSLDPNQIQLTGFTVDISPIGDVPTAIASTFATLKGSALLHYQVPWAGGVSSGGGMVSATVEAFPVALAQQLLQSGGLGLQPSLTVNLTIQALGTTNNGSKMQSDPFSYPVDVCAGCLVANVANVPSCPFASAAANPGNPCNPSQDTPIDCCLDNGQLLCPPTVVSQ
jgi:hypothetical protein